MDYLTLLLLAIGMSLDDFALALGISMAAPASKQRDRVLFAVKMAVAFSISTVALPLLGWLLGLAVYGWLVSFSAWVILVVFRGVGIWVIKEALEDEEQAVQGKNLGSFRVLLLLGTLGSFDEGATGLSYAFLNIPVMAIVAAVAIANTILVFIATFISARVPESYQKFSRIIAGVVLIGLGIFKCIDILTG
jgi:putative Mn2+ efflux pump MntP